jgi:hypothetical protein
MDEGGLVTDEVKICNRCRFGDDAMDDPMGTYMGRNE